MRKVVGLKVVAFDRSPFMLFTLRFSNKSVLAPSCERPKTAQRTLFLSSEINNCSQLRRSVGLRHTFHITHLTETTSSPMFEMTVRIGKSCQITWYLACRQRINSDVWIDHVACKLRGFFHHPPTLYRRVTITYFKWQKQGSLRSFRPLTGWGLHKFFWKFQREELKARPIKWYQILTHLFSHWPIPLIQIRNGIKIESRIRIQILASGCGSRLPKWCGSRLPKWCGSVSRS